MKLFSLTMCIIMASLSTKVHSQTLKNDQKMEARNEKIFQMVINDGLNSGDMTVIDKYFSTKMIHHDFPDGTPQPDAWKARYAYFKSAFPDIQFIFESHLVKGDRIVGRAYFTGTHKGEFNGIPATGKKVKVNFMDEWRFENGQVVEYWGVFDIISLLQQLGAMPTPQ